VTLYDKKRTPRNYDGTGTTSHQMRDFLSTVLQKVQEVHSERPDLILAAWPQIIGPQLLSMTQAISFTDGVLLVSVKNSTLHSLLSLHDKPRILRALRHRFPKVNIRNIIFRIG
jgi:hypothetical protein